MRGCEGVNGGRVMVVTVLLSLPHSILTRLSSAVSILLSWIMHVASISLWWTSSTSPAAQLKTSLTPFSGRRWLTFWSVELLVKVFTMSNAPPSSLPFPPSLAPLLPLSFLSPIFLKTETRRELCGGLL